MSTCSCPTPPRASRPLPSGYMRRILGCTCPACGQQMLAVGANGIVRCCGDGCPDRGAAAQALTPA